MNFDFLSNVEVTAPEKAAAVRSTMPKLPEGEAIRVFATGKVYPSKDLVAKYNLEYQNKDSENLGNGFDFFKSSDWTGFPTDAPETYLFIAAIPKTSPKVSIFGSCGYNEDGTPKVSVTEQGGGKAGKDLLALIEEVFGITVEKGSYVDIIIKEDISIPSNTNVFYLPKTTTKKDGTTLPDVVRRENIVVNPVVVLTPEADVEAEDTPEEAPAENTAENDTNPFAQEAPVDQESPASPEMPDMPAV